MSSDRYYQELAIANTIERKAERMINDAQVTNTTNPYYQTCAHRLPCGYCPLMSRQCPMQSTTITWSTPYSVPTIDYNNITCGSTEVEVKT